jgi:Exo-beta-D-glucosaminidase Ig-fold domain/Concanavalin A-like lectin/glucanases superfamily/Glycosyl hydrolases family 2/Glycosyl hydrolases family 2, sugar binding domain/Glycosyl hydrolases family 2, TIM barrel domain
MRRAGLLLSSLLLVGVTPGIGASEGLVFGPFGAEITGKGGGHQGWFQGRPPTEPKDAWSLSVWVKPGAPILSRTLVAGFGDGLDLSGSERFFSADSGGWYFFLGSQQVQKGRSTAAPVPSSEDALTPDQVFLGRLPMHAPVITDRWQMLSATYDGSTLRLFVNGRQKSSTRVPLARAAMEVLVAPPPPTDDGMFFNGSVAGLSVWDRAISPEEIGSLSGKPPGSDFQPDRKVSQDGIPPMRRVGPWMGSRSAITPQNPSTMPRPVPTVGSLRIPKVASPPQAGTNAAGDLVLDRGWELQDASMVSASPDAVASPGLDTAAWHDATVPGTVLTTLVQQGVYPDPLHGLNNLLIPDNLSRASWWYRTVFKVPADWNGRKVGITLNGINYHAEAWLNGRPLGDVTGAFIRGSFDATGLLKPGESNVLAVRVWPQPHNGAAAEESLRTDAGPNGADGTLDGPTFFCTEGWDWIPTIRDRCTGIWQDVVLHSTGPVALGDSKVTTVLPRLPDLSVARITIGSEVKNLTGEPRSVTVEGSLAGAVFKLPVSLKPHETVAVTFSPERFPQLEIRNPKLWWPNGYGEPALHTLALRVVDGDNQESDHSLQRVGLREITASYDPLLVLSVNGRRVFCKGGNWGLDDAMKRISRRELEPYIRLHRDANITMIRNWCGQSQSEAFYALCDEYGLLVFNEFWLTTGNFDMAASDADLFMANASDTVRRYRNHACIALWCGRNEGSPPPWIADRLADLLQKEDGTRPYVPKSTGFPVTGGGPYYYVDPRTYFGLTDKKNFKTELGVNSVPTAGAMRAMLDESQLWPISDSWAYHDFHDKGSDYLKAVNLSYGDSDDLDSFVKRAQMINYVSYRAMFEAWNAKLWNHASGLLIWMTHPAWPSTIWQIYSHDYDTHASFYGVKKACEPVHIQWNLDDDTVAVINNLRTPLDHASVTVSLRGLDGKVIKQTMTKGTFPGEAATVAARLDWSEVAPAPVVFLKLELRDTGGTLLSENFYWHSGKPEDLKSLNMLPLVGLNAGLDRTHGALEVSLKNPTKTPALMTHLALLDGKSGARILPAYYQDNYLSLLPGEERKIRVEAGQIPPDAVVSVEGWNVEPLKLSPRPISR